MQDPVTTTLTQPGACLRALRAVAVRCLLATVLAGAGGAAASTLSPTTFDFGGQSMATISPSQAFTFTNNTASPVTISGITVSAQFAQTNNCPASVAAAGTCTITVTFNPAIAAGAVNSTTAVAGTLSVASNDPGSPTTATLAGTAEKSLITHYYRSILRRAPDAPGKTFWQGEATRVAAAGQNVNETWYAMAQSFFASAEYTALARDNAGFMSDLYMTFFNRAPDSGGLTYWTGQLGSGLPREVALASFMFSTEFTTFTQAIFGNTAVRKEIDVVGDFYRGILGRLPDNAGFTFWLQQFRTAQCQGAAAVNTQVESISSQFATGAEYVGRARTNAQYVGDLYNAFLRRGGDLAGTQFWITQLTTNAQTREQIRKSFVASTEFQARVSAVVAQGCLGKVYYVSPTGLDTNTGLSGAPWKTFTKAWTVLLPSDVLLVMDGSYTNASPPTGKSGAAGQPIVVQAVNPGAAIINGLSFKGNAYLTFVGFRINGTTVAVNVASNGVGKPSHDLTFKQIGFSCTPGTLNDSACFSMNDGTHHVLVEDSWGFGGGRYTMMCYGGPGGSPPNLTCDNNTFRRLVLRMGPALSSGGNPQAALSLYYASSNTVENVIAIDGKAASDSSNSAFYITGHAPPPNADFNKYYGVIALNNLGAGIYLDCPGAICNGVEIRNSLFWGSERPGITVAAGTGTNESCDNVIVDHNTSGLNGTNGYENYACDNATMTNNAFYSNTGVGARQSPSGGNTPTNHHNGYFNNAAGPRSNLPAGTGDLTVSPNFAHFLRLEASSPYKNTGSPGDIGATIVNRYQDGVLTGTPLWPWPFEDRIKAEMCAGVTTGFCASPKTLTRYLWEYLGTTIPAGIYPP